MRRFIPAVLIISALLAACAGGSGGEAPGQPDADAVAAAVQATMEALNTQPGQSVSEGGQNDAPAQSPTSTTAPAANPPAPAAAGAGTVSGKICYPSEGIPPMTVYFEDINSGDVAELAIARSQNNYSTQLPAGSYHVYAWRPDFSIGGSYSAAVACGLSAGCSDHSMLQVVVEADTETGNVDVCDWYTAPGDIPLPPNADEKTALGGISGSLGFPSEGIPALQVVVFNLDTNQWWYVLTVANQSSYEILNLPPGNYWVVAYAEGSDYGGGYSEFVPCGLSVDCSSHQLITVVVKPGETTSGVNPVDFYAPEGAFPANPAK